MKFVIIILTLFSAQLNAQLWRPQLKQINQKLDNISKKLDLIGVQDYYILKDSIIFHHIYDTIPIYDTIQGTLFEPPDSFLFWSFKPDTIMNTSYLVRPVMDWVTFPLKKQMKGSTLFRNFSYTEYISDSTLYCWIILYDSTFTDILFETKIYVPDIQANEYTNVEWNSGTWVFPYIGNYYFRRIIYKKIGGFEDVPIRGYYSKLNVR